MLRVGKKRKKARSWRHAKGGDSKIRLKERGYQARPTIGWGSNKAIRDKIQGFDFVRIENVKQLEKLKKDTAIMIASIGKKKRNEILAKAKEMNLKVLNKYKEKNESKK